MKKALGTSLFLLLYILSMTALAQNNENPYPKFWNTVQKYELQGLPKSAAEVVDSIYEQAQNEDNHPQLVKTLLYKSKFMLTLEEDAQLKVVNEFKEEIAKSEVPLKNVLENVLANIYWQYYQHNRWKFYNRTQTEEKVDSLDFRTWDLETLLLEVNQCYQSSLEDAPHMQEVDLNAFNDILVLQEDSKTYRPTLFDFLAHNALEFYKSGEPSISRPAYKFEITDSVYFKDVTNLSLKTADSASLNFNALKIYQQLLRIHANDEDPTAFVTVDLERLEFVKNNARLENAEQHYLNALKALKATHEKHPISTTIDFEIATFYNQQADLYQPKTTEAHRFDRKTALEICKRAIAAFPESAGAEDCEVLKNDVLSNSLSIKAESYTPIGSPSRLLVEFKHIESLSFRVYKLSPKEEENFYKLRYDSAKVAFINGLKATNTWEVTLRNEFDYQQHASEVVVPALPQGNFLIVAAEKEGAIDEDQVFGYSFVQVTNLALIQTEENNVYRYQVVDRNNGAPISGAKLKFFERDSERKQIISNKVSDKHGISKLSTRKYHYGVQVKVTTKTDDATFGNYYIYNYHRNHDSKKRATIKPFLFTDRSIYRPGQKVYFKGILLKTQGEKSEVVADQRVKIFLGDVNHEEVASMTLETNEFGSFSGEFILPGGGLTRKYNLYVVEGKSYSSNAYFENARHYFSVEEYKRPKFETQFEPVTGTYQVNDTITVEGTAAAFAGSNITNAKVVYRVHRKVQYPPWFYWHRPHGGYSSEAQEITHGETTTDAEGKFSIDFAAIPDLSVSRENLPVFHYEITADVTDLNGETRSAATVVKVGYHTLTATMQLPGVVKKEDDDPKIAITTQNLNGEFVPAKGSIRIYKLLAPENVLRDRPWNAPDYQEIPKPEFKKLFPHDPYENEDDEANWEKELVFETNFDTETEKEILLTGITKWTSGKYLVELESKDKLGQEVKDQQKFVLHSDKDKKVADQALFTITTDKATYKVGEKVKLSIGSAAKDIYVTIELEKNHKVVSTQIVRLNDNIKTLQFPVEEGDIGGFAIRYSLAGFNGYKSGTEIIAVPQPNEQLEIETLTFRDKLQPGSNQTWSFKLKGEDGDKVAAEMLAGMYDASLDQFQSHSWSFNPVQVRNYYSTTRGSARESFSTQSFNMHNLNSGYGRYSYNLQRYDALDWFGFSLTNDYYTNRNYLSRIAEETYYSSTHPDLDNSREKGFVLGKITDDSGAPLPGAVVSIKGKNAQVTTNSQGNYSIKAEDGDELIYRFKDYETARATVGMFNIIDVILAPRIDSWENLVVAPHAAMLRKRASPVTEESVLKEVVFEEAPEREVAISIRGNASMADGAAPLYIVDGVTVDKFVPDQSEVLSMETLEDDAATALYGAKAANGVVVISTKEGQKKLDEQMAQVTVRTNLQETAFFYPHLTTDSTGNFSFNFTAPEALTRWKLQLLAHTKTLEVGTQTLQTVTQKDLMVMPNAPRFLRQGDKIVFSTKIANLTAESLNGFAALQLFDAITGKPVDEKLGNLVKNKAFQLDARGNTEVSWKLTIPDDIQALQYKVVAKAGDFSDGEQSALPVLTNRMLVTETLPMWIRADETKTFTLDKLKNNSSSSLKHHQLTLEMTSSPAWYAVQALPYLMQYPYDCAEQTFARFYANALASHIVNSNPRVKAVFDQWAASGALESSLEKNQELKSLIIQETPWLRDAQSESEQKRRMALLFDLNKMNDGLEITVNKLREMQMREGGFPWFQGSRYPNRYITQHIVSGYGHLRYLDVAEDVRLTNMMNKALQYLDKEMLRDYERVWEQAAKIRENSKSKAEGIKKEKEYIKANHLNSIQVHYLYMRSFYEAVAIPEEVEVALAYFKNQATIYWMEQPLYLKGMIALIQDRNGNNHTAAAILNSLDENSITSEELGMYWKANKPGWYWQDAPVETQALMIEAFSEIKRPGISADAQRKTVDELKIWLLKNKQTNQWNSTKATTEAVYALLLQGSDWISVTDMVDVTVGNRQIEPTKLEAVKVEAGTGYFKTAWTGSEITPEMSMVKIGKSGNGVAWGGLYWQYFEDLDKITGAETPLKLNKKLFLKKNTDTGEKLTLMDKTVALQVGDLLSVRIELKVDREMDFVHMKDMRASGLEPVNVLSQYKWQDGLGYYESTKDASTNFFFERLPKGVYVFEYDLRVNNKGDFSNGITTIQCMYAPEFSSHSEGVSVVVE